MATWQDAREIENLRESDNLRESVSYAIQSQYSASPKILGLAAAFQTALDMDNDLFYDNIVNIYTASGISLDRWGRILGIGRTIDDLILDDESFRQLLLYKAAANISSAEMAALNNLLALLINTNVGGFPSKAYVLYIDIMMLRWVFEDFLTDTQLAIFAAAGTLARGAGVGWEFYAVDPGNVFGFNFSLMQPFNQAPFASDNALMRG